MKNKWKDRDILEELREEILNLRLELLDVKRGDGFFVKFKRLFVKNK